MLNFLSCWCCVELCSTGGKHNVGATAVVCRWGSELEGSHWLIFSLKVTCAAREDHFSKPQLGRNDSLSCDKKYCLMTYLSTSWAHTDNHASRLVYIWGIYFCHYGIDANAKSDPAMLSAENDGETTLVNTVCFGLSGEHNLSIADLEDNSLWAVGFVSKKPTFCILSTHFLNFEILGQSQTRV